MTGRILQFILGVVIFICSTPAGMAKEASLKESRAACFAQTGVSDSDRQTFLSLEELALLPAAEITIESEDSTEGEQQVKRGQKRYSQHAKRLSRYVFTKALFVEKATERAACHPQQQDVQQERTAGRRIRPQGRTRTPGEMVKKATARTFEMQNDSQT